MAVALDQMLRTGEKETDRLQRWYSYFYRDHGKGILYAWATYANDGARGDFIPD